MQLLSQWLRCFMPVNRLDALRQDGFFVDDLPKRWEGTLAVTILKR